jgi:formylglycine-generating enzyme required for sulfatase activity
MPRPASLLLALSATVLAGLAVARWTPEPETIRPTAPLAQVIGAKAPPAVALAADIPDVEMALVRRGTYQTLYRSATGQDEVEVAAFRLAVRPVTNVEFLAFARANPRWRRSTVAPLFAEDGYLSHWAGDLALGDASPGAPVVNVSWFAARAYAAWAGGRLPTTHEWERAASASATRADGRTDPAFTRTILARYSRPTPHPLPDAGQGAPNVWGVRDLHGLVWEWTGDFTSTLVSADSRQSRDANSRRYCAAGAVGASDFENYAAFLRYGYRAGLEARYAVPNLGFRLAADA